MGEKYRTADTRYGEVSKDPKIQHFTFQRANISIGRLSTQHDAIA